MGILLLPVYKLELRARDRFVHLGEQRIAPYDVFFAGDVRSGPNRQRLLVDRCGVEERSAAISKIALFSHCFAGSNWAFGCVR
jgi:hypothetical protein